MGHLIQGGQKRPFWKVDIEQKWGFERERAMQIRGVGNVLDRGIDRATREVVP